MELNPESAPAMKKKGTVVKVQRKKVEQISRETSDGTMPVPG